MQIEILALVPPMAALFLFALTLGGESPWLVDVSLEAAKALALIGLWVAMLAHDKGDYLRRAWFLLGLGFALFIARDLMVFVARSDARRPEWNVPLSACVVFGNLAHVMAAWMLTRVWRMTALALPGWRGARFFALAVAVLTATTIAGPGAVSQVRLLLQGDWRALAGVASAIGDLAMLSLIAPLALTAAALRAGRFGWPFTFLATSCVCWLLYDTTTVLPLSTSGFGSPAVTTVGELFRVLGCAYMFSAGMAQRVVLKGIRGSAEG